MTPLSIIKEQYSNMSDEALIHFASNESDRLTPESFRLLLDEFQARGLDPDVIESAKTSRQLSEAMTQKSIENNAAAAFEESLFDYVMEQQQKGKTTLEIYKGLLKKGASEEIAFVFIQTMDSRLKHIIEHFDAGMIKGALFIGVGLVVFTLYTMDFFNNPYVLYAIFSTLAGIVIALLNWIRKLKYQKVLTHFEKDPLELPEPNNHLLSSLN